MAPVSISRREFADVILPPFEMAIRLGGACSVMPTYIDLDGVPATADGELISGLLRTELGFDGLVVSDYYAVSFLEQQHSVAASPAEAGAAALHAGIDVELPTSRCYGTPLRKAIEAGLADEAAVDLATTRVLTRKCEGHARPRLDGPAVPRGRRPAQPGPAGAPEAGRTAGRGIGDPAGEPARRAPAPGRLAGRRRRAARRRPTGVLRLLQHAAAPGRDLSRCRRQRAGHHRAVRSSLRTSGRGRGTGRETGHGELRARLRRAVAEHLGFRRCPGGGG